MMIKFSILAVAIIGIASAGNLQNLFRPVGLPKLFGQPPVYFYQVAANTAAPGTAAPVTAAPVTVAPVTAAPVTAASSTAAPVATTVTPIITSSPAPVNATTVATLSANRLAAQISLKQIEDGAVSAGVGYNKNERRISCTTGTLGNPVRTVLTAGGCVICFCAETVTAATAATAVPATCRTETCPATTPATLWANAATFTALPELIRLMDWTIYTVPDGYVYSEATGGVRNTYHYITTP